MNIPDIPEYAANYFNFIIDCIIDPKSACSNYKAVDKIDKDLLTYSALGIGFSLITISTSKKVAEFYGDKSKIFSFSDKIDFETITLIALPTLIFLSLLVHFLVKIFLKIQRTNLRVNFKNTINGVLVFFSYAPFLLFFLFQLNVLLLYNFEIISQIPWLLFLSISPSIVLCVAYIFWYFPMNLSLMQPSNLEAKYSKAIYSIYGFLVVLSAIIDKISGN